MSKAIFKSNRGSFFRTNDQFVDMVTGHMAQDIEVAIKATAGTPVKKGMMKAMVRHFRAMNGKFRVEAGAEYSAVQEAGIRLSGPGAPTARFTHYTTPGTSAGWFGRAILSVVRNRQNYISEAARALNL